MFAAQSPPLHLAIARGSNEATSLLIEKGADVNAINATGDTPLHLAAQNPGPLIKTLLDAGANANLKNFRGDLPLHLALRRPDDFAPVSTITYSPYSVRETPRPPDDSGPRGARLAPLIAASDINARDQNGLSPLLEAILARDQEARDLIIARAPRADSTIKLFDAV